MDVNELSDIPPWEWPETADQIILDALEDRSLYEADRLLAIELAGNFSVVCDALVDALLIVLRSTSETQLLRSAAAIALGPVLESADQEDFDPDTVVPISERTFHVIQESLRKLFDDPQVPQQVRQRVLEASVRAPQVWHYAAIRAAHASDNLFWNRTAVFCMQFVRGFEDEILRALRSHDEFLRHHAIVAAGAWEIAAAWPRIAALLKRTKRSKLLLLAAIEAAPTVNPIESLPLLMPLVDAADPEISQAADEAIGVAGRLARQIDAHEDADDGPER